MGTLCPLSGPGRASALLYPGCDPVSIWYYPHPALLSTQGKAGQSGVRAGRRSGRVVAARLQREGIKGAPLQRLEVGLGH